MRFNSKTVLLLVVAAVVLVWGLDMKDKDDGGGYSDETTYYSEAELRERQKVIDEMAKMRGETPMPTATPKPEKEEEQLEGEYADIEMQELPQSFSLKRAGYDPERQIAMVEFNMTGLIYAYFDVPQEEWDKLMEAENFDKWFEVMIMKKFEFKQLN